MNANLCENWELVGKSRTRSIWDGLFRWNKRKEPAKKFNQIICKSCLKNYPKKNLKSLKFIHTFSLSHSYSPPLSLSTLALRLSHSFSPLILLLNPFGGGLCFLRFDQWSVWTLCSPNIVLFYLFLIWLFLCKSRWCHSFVGGLDSYDSYLWLGRGPWSFVF